MQYEESERKNILREIGIGGERYALEQVKQYFTGQGYESIKESESVVELQKGENNFVSIIYGDFGNYHQVGWDILVKCQESAHGSENSTMKMTEHKYYIEVKTHTPGSCKRNQFQVSNEQMKLAALQQDHYVLMQVVYSHTLKQGIKCDTFINPVKCLGEGTLKGTDTYWFWF